MAIELKHLIWIQTCPKCGFAFQIYQQEHTTEVGYPCPACGHYDQPEWPDTQIPVMQYKFCQLCEKEG